MLLISVTIAIGTDATINWTKDWQKIFPQKLYRTALS